MGLIRRKELQSVPVGTDFLVGMYVTDRDDVYYISEQVRPCVFSLQKIHPETHQVLVTHTASLSTLKEYYKPMLGIDKLRDLANRVLDGDGFEDMEGDSATELMSTNGKSSLVTLRNEAQRAALVAENVKRYAEIIIKRRTSELQAKLDGVRSVIEKMNEHIRNLDYAIQIVETYAGIKERVEQLKDGISANEGVPVIFRQAVIFIDEELALIEDDFDYRKMGRFDEWLLRDDNFKRLLPDEKSMVACKPRRTAKKYCDSEWLNRVMNQPNFETLFLIRNGDNLYRLESEHVILDDRMFPNQDEFLRELEKEEKDSFFNKGRVEQFQRRFTRVAFLLQGLMERSDVFSPHSFSGSFIKMDGLDAAQVQLSYELDFSRALSDGRPSPEEWIKELNSLLCEGKRVLIYDYNFDKDHDFIRYYRSKHTAPELPRKGLYTLYDNPNYIGEPWYGNYKHIIRYLPSDYFKERVNRESIRVCIESLGLLNYDDASLEDVDYYLNSRLHRSKYYSFVKMMKFFKDIYNSDKKAEDDYVQMMVGQLISKGYRPKDGLTLESVVRKAIDIVKGRLKWKRPITAKEKETYTLVSKTLFSKTFVKNYMLIGK